MATVHDAIATFVALDDAATRDTEAAIAALDVLAHTAIAANLLALANAATTLRDTITTNGGDPDGEATAALYEAVEG